MDFNPDILPPDFRRETFDRFTPEKAEHWLSLRHRAKTDLLFLATEVLGMDFQAIPHKMLFDTFLKKDPGKQLFELDTVTKKRMTLWPRNHYKTSAERIEAVQLILNYPDIRIVWVTGTKPLGRKQVTLIRNNFSRPTEKFQYLFPEFCVTGRHFSNTSEFTVPARTKTFMAEPTCATSTAKSVKAGSHFDVAFIDDLVNDQNWRNPDVLEKTKEDYKDTRPLLDPRGYVYLSGTRYAFNDCYGWLLEEVIPREIKESGSSTWNTSIKTCWAQICSVCGHGDALHDQEKHYQSPPCTICNCPGFVDSGKTEVLFPQTRTTDGRLIGFTVEGLENERREYGDEFFALQYENRVIPKGQQTFTPELLNQQTLWHLQQLPPLGSSPVFFVGDLSYVGSNDRDLSVIYVCQLQQGQIFVRDCISGKWNTEEVTNHLFEGMLRYRPRVIYLERFLGWEAYDYAFRSLAATREIQRLPVEWMKMSQVKNAKQIRVGGILGPLSQKRLWLFGGMPGYETLCFQLKRYTGKAIGKRDDFADCLGLVIVAPTNYHMTPLPKPDAIPEFLKKAKEEDVNQNYPDNGAGSGIAC